MGETVSVSLVLGSEDQKFAPQGVGGGGGEPEGAMESLSCLTVTGTLSQVSRTLEGDSVPPPSCKLPVLSMVAWSSCGCSMPPAIPQQSHTGTEKGAVVLVSASKSWGLTSLRYPTSLHSTPLLPLFKPLSSCVLIGAVPPESPCLYSLRRSVHCPWQLSSLSSGKWDPVTCFRNTLLDALRIKSHCCGQVARLTWPHQPF